ncbi:LysR family transcriptional regulator, partial [Pseudomonas aeruginosa]|nr:LysR family transcriptional regulator [Pseudomonas aeruginosa]
TSNAFVPFLSLSKASKGSAYGLVSRAGRSLSPAAAVFVERVLEQDRRFAAT